MNNLLQDLGVIFIILVVFGTIIIILFAQYIFKDEKIEWEFRFACFLMYSIILAIWLFYEGYKYKKHETIQSSTIQGKAKDCDSTMESTIRSNKIQEESSRNRQK